MESEEEDDGSVNFDDNIYFIFHPAPPFISLCF